MSVKMINIRNIADSALKWSDHKDFTRLYVALEKIYKLTFSNYIDNEISKQKKLEKLLIEWAKSHSKCDFTDDACDFNSDDQLWENHAALHAFIVENFKFENIKHIYKNRKKS